MKLTERQRRFVEAFMGEAEGNGARAAELAGYAGDSKQLAKRASELMTKEDVRAAIEERVEADPRVATREERQRWWTEVMKNNEVEMRHRLEASKLLGRSQGDFIGDRDAGDADPVTVVIMLPDNGRGDGPPTIDVTPTKSEP